MASFGNKGPKREPGERKRRKRLKREAKARLQAEGRDRDPLATWARARVLGRALEEVLAKAAERFSAEDTGWMIHGLMGRIRQAFEMLRDELEKPGGDITWDEPFLELRFEVRLDDPSKGPVPVTDPLQVSEDDLTDKAWDGLMKALRGGHKSVLLDKVAQGVSTFTDEFFELATYATATGWTALLRDGNEYEMVLLKSAAAEVVPGDRVDAHLETFCRPFVLIGGQGPELTFEGETDGVSFRGSLVAELHPLIIDVDEQEVFYPLVVGLRLEGSTSPAGWSEKDREAFWKEVFKGLDELADRVQKFGTTSETGTLPPKGLRATVSPVEVLRTSPPPERKPLFPVAFGSAVGDAQALELLDHLRIVRPLAKRWSSLKSWPALVEAEIQRLREEEGEAAFEDLRATTRDAQARGPLLKRRFRAGGEEKVELTAEAVRRLKLREGLGAGYRFEDRTSRQEYFVRVFQLGRGYLEVGLSWYGLAGPWVEDWSRGRLQDLKAQARQEVLILDELDARERERVELAIRRFQSLEDGRRMMEAVLGQVSRQARNPVTIPAIVFRELLDLTRDKDWKARVEGGLHALQACSFRIQSFDTETLKGYGSFLSSWVYRAAGVGAHGDGVYSLNVEPRFVGCLSVFESGKRRLASRADIVLYDFGKKPTPEEKKELGWDKGRRKKAEAYETRKAKTYVRFDAGAVFYNTKAGLTGPQSSLVHFLERELTLRKDAVSRFLGDYRTRIRAQANPRDPDSHKPRLYGRDFCPLLPDGKLFHGALGHFTRHPETGRTLYGTRTRSTATGGPHTGGLLSVLGYSLPPGAARDRRGQVLSRALQDLKAVVVDYLDGVVAARGPDGRWLSLEEASRLPERDLGQKTKWYLFLPETWREDRKRKWEDASGWKATEDPAEAERAREAFMGETELRHRLRDARLKRSLRLEDVGQLLGVSKVTVFEWEQGPEPDEDGKVRGKLIPRDRVPLITRWVETGEPPSPEELEVLKGSRRPDPPGPS